MDYLSIMSDNFDSISISNSSEFTNKEEELKYDLINENDQIIDFEIKCPICYKNARIQIDLDNNCYSTICDNQHKNESHSYNSFLQNSLINLNNLLCHECQKSEEGQSKLLCCNKCFLFFCSDCNSKHTKETSHKDFISIDKMNDYCIIHNEKYKYFDNNKKRHLCQKCLDDIIHSKNVYTKNIIELSDYIKYEDTIDEYLRKAKENVKMFNNISRAVNEWLKDLTLKYHSYLNNLKNYCELQYKIVSSLSFENKYEKLKNNFNIYYNYLIINNKELDKLILKINNRINYNHQKISDIYQKSKFYLDLLNDINNISQKELKKESKIKDILRKDKQIGPLYSELKKDEIDKLKIENMNKRKYELGENATSFIPFDNDKYLIIGYENGLINIYQEKKAPKENEKNSDEKSENHDYFLGKLLSIKEFKYEINNICELDKGLIIASDIHNNIKIIEIKDNLKNYSIIQEIEVKDKNDTINTINFLPIFTYYRNRHHFCIGLNNHLLIYKSNKMPKKLEPPGLGYKDQIEEFSIVQPSFSDNTCEDNITFNLELDLNLNTKINNIIEINEKYMAVACEKAKCVKIFNMQDEFKEAFSLPNIHSWDGNCNLKVSKDRKKLFVGCVKGFCVISTDNFKKYNYFQLNQHILCLDFFYNNNCMVVASLKNDKDFYIKQYMFNNDYKDVSKFSETKTYSSKMNNLRVINNKIFYLDKTNYIHFFNINNNYY